MDRFNFPVTMSPGRKTSLTYASVTGSIIKKIKEAGHGEFYGKPVCPPPGGQFQIILSPHDCGLGEGKVRLLFSYPNLYLEAFSAGENWYRFKDTPEQNVPGRVSQQLPFGSGYTNRGMNADFTSIRFGKNTIVEIYKVLSTYPNNSGGVAEIKEVLAKVCVLFPEAIRFPKLRYLLVYILKCIATQTVEKFAANLQDWGSLCRAIRGGTENFDARLFNAINTFEELLSWVSVLLHEV